MPVVDASVLVEYLGRGEGFALARARLLQGESDLWVPHLADVEVGDVLRRSVARGTMDPTAAGQALEDLAAIP